VENTVTHLAARRGPKGSAEKTSGYFDCFTDYIEVLILPAKRRLAAKNPE
jgi:hypothetical protein